MTISSTHLNRLRSTWVTVTVIAIAATLWHVIIGYQIGLYGETSSEMGFLRASWRPCMEPFTRGEQ